MNEVTLAISVSEAGHRKLCEAIQTNWMRQKEKTKDFAYNSAKDLIDAATTLASNKNGTALRWDYLPDGWGDIAVLTSAIEELTDNGFAWQRIYKDYYDSDYDSNLPTSGEDAVAFNLAIDEDIKVTDLEHSEDLVHKAPKDSCCAFCGEPAAEFDDTEYCHENINGQLVPVVKQTVTCAACDITYVDTYVWEHARRI